MRSTVLIVLVFVLKAMPSFAVPIDTAKLFYAINKYELSQADKDKIKVVVAPLRAADSLNIMGYADYLGSTGSNAILSENRANAVKEYVATIKKNIVMLTEGRGEIPAHAAKTAEGDPLSRRVDIIAPYHRNAKNITAKTPGLKKPPGPPAKISFSQKIDSLGKLEAGKSIGLEELTFLPGRHFPNPESVRYADTLLNYLKKNTKLRFELVGHICCEYGTIDGLDIDTKRMELSLNRAKFIYDYFVKNGIAPDRMSYKGLGSRYPKIYPELSTHDQYINRRVEIVVASSKFVPQGPPRN